MKSTTFSRALLAAPLLLCIGLARGADWSDTSVGYRYGTKFSEPFQSNDISKNIFNLTHVSGYKYGTNFVNVDLLLSDGMDPSAVGSSKGAHQVYAIYRHTLDLGKASGTEIRFGTVRGVGITAGFDFDTKTDAGYNSRTRMLAVGPTLMLDVPGFLNVSVLELWESNAPYNGYTQTRTPRYSYDPHPEINLAWGIPFDIGFVPVRFEGYADFIASKGKDEFGGNTAAETHIDMRVMYEIAGKKTFRVGLEYEYWKNKFGNDCTGPAGTGAFAKTLMIRAEYRF